MIYAVPIGPNAATVIVDFSLHFIFAYKWAVNTHASSLECGQEVGIWQILKFFDQIPQDGKRKVNQKRQNSPHPRGKNLNKQYYNTI